MEDNVKPVFDAFDFDSSGSLSKTRMALLIGEVSNTPVLEMVSFFWLPLGPRAAKMRCRWVLRLLVLTRARARARAAK